MDNEHWQQLRAVVLAGDREQILGAISELPDFLDFLASLFSLEPSERDWILAAVINAFDTEEDVWEIIEAAAMDTVAQPERGTFLGVIPHIPPGILNDALMLTEQFTSPEVRRIASEALNARLGSL